MCHETSFLEYTGDVKPEQNNFAGIGATGGGVPGNSFTSEELGIIAHYAHLAWYYYPNDVNEYCNKTYDPRHFGTSHMNYTGDTTVGFLNGRWAPGTTYTDKIILFANQVIQGISTGSQIAPASVTANAGLDKEGNIGQNLNFDASSSIIQATGDISVSYSWDWNGDGTYDNTVSTAVVKHIFGSPGVFDVALKISLSSGLESIDKIKVTINSDPTADAGGPYTGKVDQSITFDGSKSTDSDGTVSEYSWDFGDNSTIGTGQKPTHTFSAAGTYNIKLIVKDDKGALSTESVASVTIEAEANLAPTANAGGPYTGMVDQIITFDGSKSTDSDGTISEYSWDFGDNSTIATVQKPTHAFSTAGTYNIKLIVKDDKGALSTESVASATIEVEATKAAQTSSNSTNLAPTANAGGPYTGMVVGQSTTFDGSKSTDSDGSIKDYLWDFGDGASGSGISPSHTFQAADTYTIKLTVVDDKDLSSTTVTTTAEITVAVNNPPTAKPGGPYSANAGVTITFDGSASTDADGTIAEYAWVFGDGSTGTGAKPTHAYSTAENYTVKLIVKDDKGLASLQSSASVTVNQVVVQPQYTANTSIITNSTSLIGYTEITVDQLVSIFVSRGSSKVEWARRIAPIYIQYGKLFNLRADIAWAQMCHETGFLEFTGDVKPEQNNFVGLGATGGGVPGNSFATEELGIIAHYAHLAWYYYPNHINQYCSITYDPRHSGTHWKYTGDTTIGFLNGRWAPGATYTDKILLFANQIYGF
jgi:PKD repeat protein